MYSPYYNSSRVQDIQGFYKPSSTYDQYNYMGGNQTNPIYGTGQKKNMYTSGGFAPRTGGLTETPGLSFNQQDRGVATNPLLSNPTGSFNENSKQFARADGNKGMNASGIAAAAGAAGDLAAQAIDMGNEHKSINTQAPSSQVDNNGKPVYNLNQHFLNTSAIKPKGTTFKEYHEMTAKGMAAGAQVGGPWGALIGAVAGSITSLIGGGRRKKKQQEAKDTALASLRRKQQEYDSSKEAYDDTRLAREDYDSRMNMQDRLYNIYNS